MLDKQLKISRCLAFCAQLLSIIVNLSQGRWTAVLLQIIALCIAESMLWYARKLVAEEEKKSAAAMRLYQQEAINFAADYFSKHTLVKSELCLGCSYLHGSNGIVCALHPDGHDGNDCIDFELKCKDEI